IVINVFVMLQIFNEINCRNLDEKLNVFKNILSNRFFITIFIITGVSQFLIIQFGGHAFQTVPLSFIQWLTCIELGCLSLPVGSVVHGTVGTYVGTFWDILGQFYKLKLLKILLR
ncbi:hypothetical protein C2G38_1972162, partial [Gigaspora rosea]